MQDLGNVLEQAEPLEIGISDDRRREIGEAIGEFGDHADDVSARQHRAHLRVGRVREPVLQHLHERSVRKRELLVAGTPQDGRAACVHRSSELRDKPGLTHAGFTGDESDARAADLDVCPRVCEARRLLGAADEHRAGCAFRGRWERNSYRRCLAPDELEQLHGRVETFQVLWSDRSELMLVRAADEEHDDTGREDLTAGRAVAAAQSRGLDDRPAEPVAVVVNGLTRAEADAHERLTRIETRRALRRLLNRLCARDRLGRAPEDRHDAVADAFDDVTVMCLDRGARRSRVYRLHLVRGLRTLAQQLGRADEIGEEHRDGLRRTAHDSPPVRSASLRSWRATCRPPPRSSDRRAARPRCG